MGDEEVLVAFISIRFCQQHNEPPLLLEGGEQAITSHTTLSKNGASQSALVELV
jgi:hypothetical protein